MSDAIVSEEAVAKIETPLEPPAQLKVEPLSEPATPPKEETPPVPPAKPAERNVLGKIISFVIIAATVVLALSVWGMSLASCHACAGSS
jgi:hypothetical protein